jgi:fumarate hydratase class II
MVSTNPPPGSRIERDSMGEMAVPADARYGATTQRAVLNFPISGQPLPRRFIEALGLIKRAAAEANAELELIEPDVSGAIATAAQAVAGGAPDADFPVDG